jgi:hypothetical protein
MCWDQRRDEYCLRAFLEEMLWKRYYYTLWPVLHVVLWSVLPPAFFFYQWKWIYLRICKGDEFESFKIGQDLATKMWAAIALLLGAIYKF